MLHIRDRRIRLYLVVLRSRIRSAEIVMQDAIKSDREFERMFADGMKTAYKTVLGELESWNPKE